MLQFSSFSKACLAGVLVGVSSLFAITPQQQKHQPLETLLAEYGYAPEQRNGLRQLLTLYGVELSQELSLDELEKELIAETQKKLLRQGERFSHNSYNQQLNSFLAEHKSQLEDAVEKIGLSSAIEPLPEIAQSSYVALVPGALEQTVARRFDSLIEHIEKGATPCLVIAVTGYRALEPTEGQDYSLSERTEAALMTVMWHNYVQKNPQLSEIKFIVSCAPLKEGQTRSNTADTVAELKKSFDWSMHQYAVIYVDQPFAQRFLRIFGSIPAEVSVKARALKNLPDDKLYYYGDEVARLLYFQSQNH